MKTPFLNSIYTTLARSFGEMHYAQRRVLEIRTGQVLTPETRQRNTRREIDRLNDLLDL